MRKLRLATALACLTPLWAGWSIHATAEDRAASVSEDALLEGFRNPPQSARPRIWWHWMNGNITKEGIARDLAWMKRIGLGGVQNFDANIATPQIVDQRLPYMSAGWNDAFRFAVTQADRLGLEFAIAASPGWSTTGGPWVAPEDAMKKLVWAETLVIGGRPLAGRLTEPATVAGPYQSIAAQDAAAFHLASGGKAPTAYYRDIMVLAFPDRRVADARPLVQDQAGRTILADTLVDGDLSSGVTLARGSSKASTALELVYPQPKTIRSITLFAPGQHAPWTTLRPRLEAHRNGRWEQIAKIPLTKVPTTVSFAPVTASRFRVVFHLKPFAFPSFALASRAPGTILPTNYQGIIAAAAQPFRITDLRLSQAAQVDLFEAKAGFALLDDYLARPVAAHEEEAAIASGEVLNLTDRLRADGTLAWTPPPGRWRVLRLGATLTGATNHPATPEATGLEVDKFDGAAVRRYLDHYLDTYRQAVGPGLIGDRGITALVTDSFEAGAANWTPRMVDHFRRLRGYDPTPWMPALTGTIIGSRQDSDRFLFDWRATLADLISSEHYRTIADVAHGHGLRVYGEALEWGRPTLGDDMAMRASADIPMAAMWSFSKAGRASLFALADVKGAASLAHLTGRNIVAAESMTSLGAWWAQAPADLRHVIDTAFVTGVNRPILHTSVHSPSESLLPGLSLGGFGQFFNRHETWADMAGPWIDYIARSAFLLQQGRPVADVAYFYGEEAPLTSLYGNAAPADVPRHNAYDFVNTAALTTLLRNDGSDLVTAGGARYRLLYLGGSSRWMSLTNLRAIARLATGGATIVGPRPQSAPNLTDAAGDREWRALVSRLWSGAVETRIGKGRVIAGNDIETALRRADIGPDFSHAAERNGEQVAFVHRSTAQGEIYFLVNRENRPRAIEARFRVSGRAPEICDAVVGQCTPASYRIEPDHTLVPLKLGPHKSLFVLFRARARTPSLTIAEPVFEQAARLDGPWSVGFQEGRGAPASAIFAKLLALETHRDAGIRHFSGIARYRKQFAAPRGWKPGRPLRLDLGVVHEIAEVLVNGKTAGTVWQTPYQLDIGAVTQVGENQLEIRVANLWANRLIGDARKAQKPITWASMPTYRPDAPLRPSGLMGPVQLWTRADGRFRQPVSRGRVPSSVAPP